MATDAALGRGATAGSAIWFLSLAAIHPLSPAWSVCAVDGLSAERSKPYATFGADSRWNHSRRDGGPAGERAGDDRGPDWPYAAHAGPTLARASACREAGTTATHWHDTHRNGRYPVPCADFHRTTWF